MLLQPRGGHGFPLLLISGWLLLPFYPLSLDWLSLSGLFMDFCSSEPSQFLRRLWQKDSCSDSRLWSTQPRAHPVLLNLGNVETTGKHSYSCWDSHASSGCPTVKVGLKPLNIHMCLLGDASVVLHLFLAKRIGLRGIFTTSLLNLRWTPQSHSKPYLLLSKSLTSKVRTQFRSILGGRFSLRWAGSSVQSLSHVWLFATPWKAACQASLSITNSQSLLKLMSIESAMPFNHLILCHPLLLPPSIFPSIKVFSSGSVLHIRWPKYWPASASVLPMNIQDWFPLGWTGWISLQSKGLSRVFSNITVQKHQFFGTQLSL